MSEFSVRQAVQAFAPYQAGRSIDEIREAYGLERVIKLASNENPLGVSPLVQRVVRERAAYAFRYPQSGNPRLVHALAAHYGVEPGRIAVGNGSDEIIDLLLRITAEPGVHNVVAFRPCFGIYTTQARLAGVELRQAELNPDFSFPWERLLSLVDAQTALVFVTNPDNPSGRTASAAEIADLARALPSRCLLVLDEAYMDFTTDEAAHSLLGQLDAFPRLAVLRTFSKSRGLAGLRVGFGILPPELAGYFWRVRLPFSLNVLAEDAALAALEDERFYQETLRVTREGRERLSRELAALGMRVWPSGANFLMTAAPGLGGAELAEALLRHGVIIRPLGSYGQPDKVRISIGTPEEHDILLEALGCVLRAAEEAKA